MTAKSIGYRLGSTLNFLFVQPFIPSEIMIVYIRPPPHLYIHAVSRILNAVSKG